MAKIQRMQNVTPPTRGPQIFLASHPIGEPDYGTPVPQIGARVHISWNPSDPHRRKFISRSGKYLEQGKEVNGEIYFWGEYEVGSEAVINSRRGRPKGVHDILDSALTASKPQHRKNTDPYVFGNHFKNTCCRRHNYVPGDMILFGKTRLDGGIHWFDFDTVFIVEKEVTIDYSPSRQQTEYFQACVAPLNNKLKYKTFYQGVAFSPSVQYYSYVPCLLHAPFGKRPAIDVGKLGIIYNKNGYPSSVPFTNQRWQEVLDAVTSAGWHIGTHIDKI